MLNSVLKVPRGKGLKKKKYLLTCPYFYFSVAENIDGWEGRERRPALACGWLGVSAFCSWTTQLVFLVSLAVSLERPKNVTGFSSATWDIISHTPPQAPSEQGLAAPSPATSVSGAEGETQSWTREFGNCEVTQHKNPSAIHMKHMGSPPCWTKILVPWRGTGAGQTPGALPSTCSTLRGSTAWGFLSQGWPLAFQRPWQIFLPQISLNL